MQALFMMSDRNVPTWLQLCWTAAMGFCSETDMGQHCSFDSVLYYQYLFWNAAMGSVNDINQDMSKRALLCHDSSTWNIVIFCILAQARTHFCSNFAGSFSGWSFCDAALQSKHMGSRNWPFRCCSNYYLFKPKAKLPVTTAESSFRAKFHF